jgi:chromosome segregation ATPase
MKLRAIEVRNWGCIGSLRLADLPDGVVVLRGGNRTGKSSLVQAIRSCLFEHDHESKDSALTAFIPWHSKATPHVTVELELAGEHYRLSKTFAKTREGQASLEKRAGAGWSTLARGKEASKLARDLLGVEKSEAGIFQILWLGQRDFHLPAPDKIDPTLREALEAVLGTLITGRDLVLKDRLDQACANWFTDKKMDYRKDSPVTRLAGKLQEEKQRLAQIQEQWNGAQSALERYEDASERHPELQRQREEAEAELQRVQKDCEAARQRLALHEVALKSLTQCQRLFGKAESDLRAFDQSACELESASKLLEELRLELRGAEDGRAQTELAAAAARQTASDAEQAFADHQQGRPALEDRQRLTTNQLDQIALKERIRQAEELDKERLELEQTLAGPDVLSDAEIKELRQKRERAALLRHQLAAAEIHIRVRARAPVNVQVASDGGAAASISLADAQENRWLIRQHAEIQIGDVATLSIGRGEEDRNLDAIAGELAEIERWLGERLRAAQLDPQNPAAIDELVARRLRHEQNARQLKSLRDSLARLAPVGISALRTQLEQKGADMQVILARRRELSDWNPDQTELENLRASFEAVEGSLRTAAQEAKDALAGLAESAAHASRTENEVKTRIARQETKVQGLQERIGRLDRAALVRERDEADQRLADAGRRVEESTPTEAERSLEALFQKVQGACRACADRVRENEDALLELRTKLAGTEGLHHKRIQAEQIVNDLQRELDRESLFAQAHKHLKELFEKVRQEQVCRTVGPINDRVIEWARQLGIADYAGLDFGSGVLPAGLVPLHAANGERVELERESYGTLEQLSLLIRLAVGGLFARGESAVAIFDDPLAHADPLKHRKMLDIFTAAAQGDSHGPHPTGPLQLIVLTCHEDRFDLLEGARQINLAELIQRG